MNGTPLMLLSLLEEEEEEEEEAPSSSKTNVATKDNFEDRELPTVAGLPVQPQKQQQRHHTPAIQDDEAVESIEGVIFGHAVQGHSVSLNLVMIVDNSDPYPQQHEDYYHVLVRIQFDTPNDKIIKDLRSYFRRYCKNGDFVKLRHGIYRDCLWNLSNNNKDHDDDDDRTDGSTEPQYLVRVQSIEDARDSLQVLKVRYFSQSQWQAWQNKYYRQEQQKKQFPKRNPKETNNVSQAAAAAAIPDEGNDDCRSHHAAGVLEKRQQSEQVAKFLLRMMMTAQQQQKQKSTTTSSSSNLMDSKSQEDQLLHMETLEYLNGGSGVLDVAGGSGLVSMALGLVGIQSTVVDPGEAAGRLPGRDRQIWNRVLKKPGLTHAKDHSLSGQPSLINCVSPLSTIMICQPVTPQVRPFQTMRAWFGTPPPVGAEEATFRNLDDANIPICDTRHPLIQGCRAIVALHPDEVTDVIVDMAVQCQIPFVIVPCCVFRHLFPHRKTASDDLVSTYQQLLDYLQAKHPSIERTTLPFVGANTVLYSTFQ